MKQDIILLSEYIFAGKKKRSKNNTENAKNKISLFSVDNLGENVTSRIFQTVDFHPSIQLPNI